jgi:ATP-dependent DNA helicase RecQ
MGEFGIAAAALNSSCSASENRKTIGRLLRGELSLLYVSPERLLMGDMLSILKQVTVNTIAVDEAHCVSQWGHDFRPEYRQLRQLAEHFPGIPRIALTATADEATRADIVTGLGLNDPKIYISGFDRPNIKYQVVVKENPRAQLLKFIRQEHEDHSGIVYCLSRSKVEQVASFLKEEGFRVFPYHAGMTIVERNETHRRFMEDEAVIVVATIAFGMGIDKPDVRFVAHLDLPKSIEAYYQETGRGGRDGLPADAWMTYGTGDMVQLFSMIDQSTAPDFQKMIERQKLEALLGYCESVRCRRQVLLEYFGDSGEACGNCDTCLSPTDTTDGTELAKMALSCVYRVEQRFGIAHVIDVLLGEKTDKVVKFSHDRLSTFGVGAGVSRKEWRAYFRQLIAMRCLQVSHEDYGALKLCDRARPILRGEESVRFRRDLAAMSTGRKGKDRAKASVAQAAPEAELLRRLKECRQTIARERKIPPYMVFHDTTLLEMVAKRPTNLTEFGTLSGVGERKLATYGALFLDILRQSQA